MAVMFMYGIIPEFTVANIGDLLELAEYLKIKELKDACVDWFDSVDYSEINCIYVIQLSKKYDFEISACMEYIESHIPETFKHTDAADLPNDLVHSLFTDERFSYVQMDDKLNFLLKLANNYPSESTKDFVIKLFKTLDLSEITPSTWETAKVDVMFDKIINLETKVRQTDQENSRKYVLIMSSDEDYFVGLDLRNDRWYRLNYSYNDRHPYEEFLGEIAGVRNDNPEVYIKECDFDEDDLITLDLESDEIHRYRPLIELDDVPNGDLVHVNITHVNITNDTIVAIVKKTIQIYEESCSSNSEPECVFSNREEETHNDINDVREEPQLSPENIPDTGTSDVSCVINTPEISRNEQSSSSSSRSSSISGNRREDIVNCTSVYVGKTLNEDVEMYSLFSFRKENITQICMNNQSVLALLTKSSKHMHVILYDLVKCKMERVLSLKGDKSEICPTDNGFILHNDTHWYCLRKSETTVFSGSYRVEKFMLENREEWIVKYRFNNGVWIRVLRRSVHNDIELQYIFHAELADYQSSIDVNWRNVSMPKNEKLFEKIMNLENIFIVTLSKRKLRCHIECPHCKFSYESDFD